MSSEVAALPSRGRGWDAGGTYGTIPQTSAQVDSLFQQPLSMSVPTALKVSSFFCMSGHYLWSFHLPRSLPVLKLNVVY